MADPLSRDPLDAVDFLLTREGGCTQARLAEMFECSQGHLSKVVARKVPLSRKLRRRIEAALPEFDSKLKRRETPEALRSAIARGNQILHNMQILLTDMQRMCDEMSSSEMDRQND
jgi:hypothetical protein